MNELVTEYRGRVSAVLAAVESWVAEMDDLESQASAYQLNEEDVGAYEAPGLRLTTASGQHVGDLEPYGLLIIGAEGRVDLRGPLGHETLLYLRAGGPALRSTLEVGGEVVEGKRESLFRGVDDDGWYWIEDPRSGRARILDKSAFTDMLYRVTDHVYAH